MASINVRLRKGRLTKSGEAPVTVVIQKGKEWKEISAKFRVKPEYWDSNRSKVKALDTQYRVKNSKLRNLRDKIEQYIDQKTVSKTHFSLEELVAAIRPKKRQDVIPRAALDEVNSDTVIWLYLDAYIRNNPKNISSDTLKYYTTAKNALKQFDNTLTFGNLSLNKIHTLDKWLRKDKGEKKGLSTNTVYNRHKVYKRIVKEAIDNGLRITNPYNKFQAKTEESQREYLTQEELSLLENYDASTTKNKLILDSFIFACYCGGIRFSDVCTLKVENIQVVNNGDTTKYKFTKRIRKNKKPLSFTIPDKAVEIMLGYNDLSNPMSWVLPILETGLEDDAHIKRRISSNNAYYSKVLKKIAKEVGITKNVSYHVSRHSFATLALTMGVSFEVLRDILGHADVRETQIYGKIIDRKIDEAMDLFN